MKKLTTKEFIKRSKDIHMNKYIYEHADYKGSSVNITITCKKHGDFEQLPIVHMKGFGCKKCSAEKAAERYKLTVKEFIEKAKKVHGEKYNYSSVEYVNNNTKVEIICPIHGKIKQAPREHLQGKGCIKCGHIITGKNKRLSLKEFITKGNKKHQNKYKYDDVVYTTANKKVIIICPVHGHFKQSASSHLSGKGCPKCASRGWSRSKWIEYCKNNNVAYATLYIVNLFNKEESFIKVGITANTITNRFKVLSEYKYSIITSIIGNPKDIFNLENKILSVFKSFKYTPKVNIDGKTECFNIDILQDENLKFLLQ